MRVQAVSQWVAQRLISCSSSKDVYSNNINMTKGLDLEKGGINSLALNNFQ